MKNKLLLLFLFTLSYVNYGCFKDVLVKEIIEEEDIIDDDLTDKDTIDNGGTDKDTIDDGGIDNGGTDNDTIDNGGIDNGGTDKDTIGNGGTDNGGTDNGGGTIDITRPDVGIGEPITLAYFPSWSENWASPGQNSKLREIPSYVNTIFLSFAKPNLRYVKGSYDIAQTGIQVPYDGMTLLESINALNNKGIRVILSVGGETYWQGATHDGAEVYDIDFQQIKDFVDDFGFAGIDWDYEPNGQISILSEDFHVKKFIWFIEESRKIMPKGEYLIACAPSGVGALGGPGPQPNGIDDSSSPYNNAYGKTLGNIYSNAAQVGASPATLFGFASSGHFIPVMKSVGHKIDIIAYQGYNAGGSTDRKVMYDAYSYYANIYGFSVVAGVHVANEPWGPYYYFNNNNVGDLAEYIYNGGRENRAGKNDGIMLWELLAMDPNNSGYEFMKLSHDILTGTSKSTAISNAPSTATKDPYTGGSEVNVGGNGSGGGTGTTHCGYSEWSSSATYATGGSKVYHNGAIWQNQWWAGADNVPGVDNCWVKIQDCNE